MISRGAIDIRMLAALTYLLSGGGTTEARFTFSVASSENYNLSCFAETIKRGLFNGGALANCCHRCLSLGSACTAVSYSALNRSCNLLSTVNHTLAAQSASGQCTLVKSEVTIMPSIESSTIRSPTTMQSTMVAAAAMNVSSLSSSEYVFSNQANGSSVFTTARLLQYAFGGSSSSSITTAAVPIAATEEQTTTAQEEFQTAAPTVTHVHETYISSIPGISSEATEKTSLVPASSTAFEPLLSTKLWTTAAESAAATNVLVDLSTAKAMAVPTLVAATTVSATTKSATSIGWGSTMLTAAATSTSTPAARSDIGNENGDDCGNEARGSRS